MKREHEVIVVGSGAGGGMSAWLLAKAGIKTILLEAGRDYDPYSETPMFQRDEDAPLLGRRTPDKIFNYYMAAIGGWELPGEPYTTGSDSDFRWFRTRMLGGRTNHWGRNSFRMGPLDFKPYSRDGLGVDWPFDYEDIAPYYDKTEALIGVYGSNEKLPYYPNSAPGVLHKPPKPRIGELMLKAVANDMGMPCVPMRRAVLTKPMDDRAACFYATACGRGCSIGAAFQTTTSLLPWAKATGNLEIVTDAMVYEVETDKKGKATGVTYIDKKTGEHKSIRARAVVLAASAGETARILLNSTSGRNPDGVGNGSGQVGRHLMDSVGSGMSAQIPALENRPRYNEDGAMGSHLHIPWWLHDKQIRGKLDFPRGYHYEVGAEFRAPGVGTSGVSVLVDGYGKQLKEDARRYYGSFLRFGQRGEMIPNDHCYAELDPERKDDFGIPILRFHYRHSEHEIRQVAHFQKNTLELIDRLGGRVISDVKPPEEAISPGGVIIHEVGMARMGDKPETSVVNEFGRVWEVDNLYLTDGSVFATKADANPTLTILALAWRSTENLIERMRRGEV